MKYLVTPTGRKAISEAATETLLNGKELQATLAKKVKELGIKKLPKPSNKLDDWGPWTDVPVKIPSEFKSLFTKIELKVRAGFGIHAGVHLEVDYNYEHPGGGRNGLTTRYTWSPKTKKWDR